jgi:hypothetical protein
MCSRENKNTSAISARNLAIGAVIQTFEVSTLGQPFEVLKTHLAGLLSCKAGA